MSCYTGTPHNKRREKQEADLHCYCQHRHHRRPQQSDPNRVSKIIVVAKYVGCWNQVPRCAPSHDLCESPAEHSLESGAECQKFTCTEVDERRCKHRVEVRGPPVSPLLVQSQESRKLKTTGATTRYLTSDIVRVQSGNACDGCHVYFQGRELETRLRLWRCFFRPSSSSFGRTFAAASTKFCGSSGGKG